MQVLWKCPGSPFPGKRTHGYFDMASTFIDLCLSVFWCTEFKKHKEGVKLHTLHDVKTFHDEEQNRDFVFLTDNFELKAILYKFATK
jgi:hypothetical protein